MGKICADLEVKQANMPKYLKTLIDLDILESGRLEKGYAK